MQTLRVRFLPLLIVFASGFCSLVYQVIWERLLKYTFGGDAISSSIITSVFLLGLGIGAFLFGSVRRNAARWYALVEAGIGLCGLLSYPVLSRIGPVIGHQAQLAALPPDAFRLALIAASVICILPVCILIGGTLPLIFRTFVATGVFPPRSVGWLYGLNTLGAAAGILGVPFLLLNRFTLSQTLPGIAAVNVMLAGLVLLAGRAIPTVDGDAQPHRSWPAFDLSLLAFWSGFLSLSVEIVFFRMASHYWTSSSYNFPFILLNFLAAMSLGSMLLTGIRGTSLRDVLRRIVLMLLLGWIGLGIAIVLRGELAFAPNLLHVLRDYAILVVPFTLCQGAVFPLLLMASSRSAAHLPGATGKLYLINAVGSFCGIWLISLVGFPLLGTPGSLTMLLVVTLILAVYLVRKYLLPAALLPLAGVALAVFMLLPAPVWNAFVFGQAVGFDGIEGSGGTAQIDWSTDRQKGAVKVNGQYMSFLPDHPKHIRLAIYPLTLKHRESILVMGLGGGGMVRELAKDPAVKRIGVVDWSGELIRLLSQGDASRLLDDVLHNPKVTVYQGDARLIATLLPDKSYDIVLDNLAVLMWGGATGVKSEQYFREIRRILTDRGTFVMDINPGSDLYKDRIIVAMLQHFKHIEKHFWTVSLASGQYLEIDHDAIVPVLSSRNHVPELNIVPGQEEDWYWAGFNGIEPYQIEGQTPIIDEDIRHEYYLNSISFDPI